MQEIKKALAGAAKAELGLDIKPQLTRPEAKFGDYSTNIAMAAGQQLGKNPREIAILLAGKLHGLEAVEKIEVAGPGFINLTLKDGALMQAALSATDLPQTLAGQEILVEFGDPNPFKEMHIGHLYSAIAGDAVASLLASAGAKVRRLSYHGDVGLHVAKAVWAMQKEATNLKNDLGVYYANGAAAYESDETAAAQIRDINKKIYTKEDQQINELHKQGIEKSFKYFDQIFDELGIDYEPEGRYLESAATEAGARIVKENIGKVFEQSEGAVVYKGEQDGLHTRVFLTSEGLPTYEAKDLGLVQLKSKDYPHANRSIIITAHEQSEYFKVMLAALAKISPDLAEQTTHLYHGFVTLSEGKMSSRTGEVYAAADLLEKVKEAVMKRYSSSATVDETYLGAVKYAFLRHRLGADITFDVNESVQLQGNSGPYLQYAHARACSILHKSPVASHQSSVEKLEAQERSLTRAISHFPQVAADATNEFAPSHITTYLYELAQTFNSFYESGRVIGDERESLRLQLVETYADVLKSGLSLLGIDAPERM